MLEQSVVCIAGDGIGPEITAAMKHVVAAATAGTDCRIGWVDHEVGRTALERGESALPESVLAALREHRFAIKGPTETPVGAGHRSVNVALRQTLDLYANVRPIRWFPGIETPIRHPERVDLVIFRENTEDVYTGIEYAAGSEEARALYDFLKLPDRIARDSAFGLKPVSERASRRLMRKAVQYALSHQRKRITIVHKGNIMKFTEGAFAQWCYDEAQKLLAERYLSSEEYRRDRQIPEGRILVQDRIADAMFQDLLLHPEQHQVIVTLNLNGDYLSDAAAALVGGLGMAPGANVGDEIVLFEAVHGTAPDIAGKDLANPSALILSAALLFDQLGEGEIGGRIREAIAEALRENRVTGDLYAADRPGERLTCSAFAASLAQRLTR